MRRTLLMVAGGLLLSSACHAATITVQGLDSTAIKAAIDKSQASDEVRLPAGIYQATETIAPKTGTKLIGAGADKTILQQAGDKAGILISLVGVKGVTIADLALDGKHDPKSLRGIAAYNSRHLTIRNVAIRNLAAPAATGIHFNGDNPTREHGCTDSRIENCVVENIAPADPWGAGIRLSWGSLRNQILGCKVHNTGRGGIFGNDGSNDLIIRSNIVTGSHGEKLGIEVWGGCDRCVIEDNQIDHWLSVGGCDWCATRRNTVTCKECSGFIGIEAIGSYLVFTDNRVDEGQIMGLSVSNINRKQYHYYRGDTYRRCSQWAVQIQGEGPGADRYYFERCRFDETSTAGGKVIYPGDEGHGLRFSYGTAHDMTFEECVMSGNARHGIQITTRGTDRLSFIRCRITGNKGAAIAHQGGFTALEWQACTVEGNGRNDLPPSQPFNSPAPTGGFTAPSEMKIGEKAEFVSTARAAGGQQIQCVLWDLGDGPPLAGPQARHVYDRAGQYLVTQIVWDGAGRAARSAARITVKP